MAKKPGKKTTHPAPPIWEWIIAALGVVLVSIAIGTAVYRALNERSTVPNISVTIDSVHPGETGYVVELQVVNSGDQTAADLIVEGQLKSGADIVETSTATLTYAPANSTRRAGLIFTRDPRTLQLTVRPRGYEEP